MGTVPWHPVWPEQNPPSSYKPLSRRSACSVQDALFLFTMFFVLWSLKACGWQTHCPSPQPTFAPSVSSVTQRVQYWVQCIRLFFQGDQITPYLSHFPPFQECGDILACHILETSPFQKSHSGLQSTLNWLLQSGFVLVDFQFTFITLFFFNCYFSVFSSSFIILFPISFIFILSPHSSFPAVALAVANSFHLCLL